MGAAGQTSTDDAGYSGTRVAKIVGISYRQLDYWARTGLIEPSLTAAAGSGSRRAYTYRDLLELRVIKSLLDAGVKLESVRLVFDYLRQHADTDIASAHLLITGRDVVLCRGDELIDVMNSRGQGVLNLTLDIGAVKTHLDAHPDVVSAAADSAAGPVDALDRVAL
jgi:DNA-binding transcriptional MerR regulator